jgi:hypothetical protein
MQFAITQLSEDIHGILVIIHIMSKHCWQNRCLIIGSAEQFQFYTDESSGLEAIFGALLCQKCCVKH